jgi:hypothetical protein
MYLYKRVLAFKDTNYSKQYENMLKSVILFFEDIEKNDASIPDALHVNVCVTIWMKVTKLISA